MSDARQRILERVRQGLGRDTPTEVTRPARSDAPMAREVGDLAADFTLRARALQSTVERVAVRDALPAALRRYVDAEGLSPRGVVWTELADLDWAGAGLELEQRPPDAHDTLGVTGAFCGIAETGTLLLHSGEGLPATTSLLPETHVAVLAVERLHARMEQAFVALKAANGDLPRALNFISGPSRTADIEQTIVIGAHGPRRVHILLVG